MSLKCTMQNHEEQNLNIEFICENPLCLSERIMCNLCPRDFHQNWQNVYSNIHEIKKKLTKLNIGESLQFYYQLFAVQRQIINNQLKSIGVEIQKTLESIDLQLKSQIQDVHQLISAEQFTKEQWNQAYQISRDQCSIDQNNKTKDQELKFIQISKIVHQVICSLEACAKKSDVVELLQEQEVDNNSQIYYEWTTQNINAGEMTSGMKNGNWLETSDSDIHYGKYFEDRKIGSWSVLTAQGVNFRSGTYCKGIKQGLWRQQLLNYFEVGNYDNGLRQGKWEYRDQADVVIGGGSYEQGEKIGLWLEIENSFVKIKTKKVTYVPKLVQQQGVVQQQNAFLSFFTRK